MRRLALLFLLLLPGLAHAAGSNVFVSPRDTVQLIAASPTQLALDFHLAKNWHIYWSNPGDAGLAPVITPAAPVTFGPLQFPPPELLRQGGITAYVLSGHIVLPFTAAHATQNITATAQWLVCSDICVPEHASFTLALNGAPSPQAASAPAITRSPFPATLSPNGTLSLSGLRSAQVSHAHFFPAAPGAIVNAASQPLSFTATGLTLKLQRIAGATIPTGILELTDPSGQMQALAVTPAPGAAPGHPPYLLFAFLGGLILNLMPCVFPILALKALAIARLGGGAKIRHEAFGYTAGVLIAMLALGSILLVLRATGAASGWGFQFQSPVFVALIAWLMFALALNLAGWFEIPAPAAIGRIPAQSSIATGILAVVLATPCTAPFMGAAIAAALSAPAFTALGIFLALGLGLALPFLALACAPQLTRFIPRPGPWMLWLQRLLSLPMLAAFAWLAFVLFHQTGLHSVALLLAGAVFLLAMLSRVRFRPLAFAVVLLVPLLHSASGASALSLPGALPYTPARLASLRAAGTPVFIDLTAAWCVTCLVNEASTLNTPAVRTAFATHHVTLLVGDWTSKNPAITALLAVNQRVGVPLYLYYSPGAATPAILPQLLTQEIVKTALSQ